MLDTLLCAYHTDSLVVTYKKQLFEEQNFNVYIRSLHDFNFHKGMRITLLTLIGTTFKRSSCS